MGLDRLYKKSEKDTRLHMRLPSPRELGDALRKWREDRGLTELEIAKSSERRSAKKFGPLQVGRWENSKQAFTYKRLIEDILPAYQIPNFDTFLDFCRPPSIEDVTVIEAGQFTPARLSDGVTDYFVAKPFLEKGQHRTRIDRVVFAPGKSNITTWGRHEGHEFVLVLEGAVDCEFAVDEDAPRKRHSLTGWK